MPLRRLKKLVKKTLVDREQRLPRVWSNAELRKYAGLFDGDVVNVSAWRDEDKEGRHYRDYFTAAKSYTLTNYKSEARGLQGVAGELFLDLTAPLADELRGKFDVVFNHTTLEHVYDVKTAFANLCAMSKDIVVLVVPFLQAYHSDYGDFWRFSPQAVRRMLEGEALTPLVVTCNRHAFSSVYVFAIASRRPDAWRDRLRGASVDDALATRPGARALFNIGAPRRLVDTLLGGGDASELVSDEHGGPSQ